MFKLLTLLTIFTGACAESVVKRRIFMDESLHQSMNAPYVRFGAEAENAKQEYEFAQLKMARTAGYHDMMQESSTCFFNGEGNCNVNFLQTEETIVAAKATAAAKHQAFTEAYEADVLKLEAAKKNWKIREEKATAAMASFLKKLKATAANKKVAPFPSLHPSLLEEASLEQSLLEGAKEELKDAEEKLKDAQSQQEAILLEPEDEEKGSMKMRRRLGRSKKNGFSGLLQMKENQGTKMQGWRRRRRRWVNPLIAIRAAAKAVADKAKAVARAAEQKVKAAARAVEQKAKAAARVVEEAKKKVERAAVALALKLKKAAEDAARLVEEKAKAAARAAQALALRVKKAAEEAVEKARKALAALWNAVKAKFMQLLNTVKSKFNEFKEEITDFSKPVMDKIKTTIKTVKDSVAMMVGSPSMSNDEIKKLPLALAMTPVAATIRKVGALIKDLVKNYKCKATFNGQTVNWVDIPVESRPTQTIPVPVGLNINTYELEVGPVEIPIPKPSIVMMTVRKCSNPFMKEMEKLFQTALAIAETAWRAAALKITDAWEEAMSQEATTEGNTHMGCFKVGDTFSKGEFEWDPAIDDKDTKNYATRSSWDTASCAEACSTPLAENKYMALWNDGAECRCSVALATKSTDHPRLDGVAPLPGKAASCGEKGKLGGYAVYRMNLKPCTGDYALWFRLGGSISLSYASASAALGVAIGCDGQGHRFAIPTFDYGLELSAIPGKASADLSVNIDYFGETIDKPPNGGSAWNRIGGFGMGVSATIGEFGFGMSTTFPGIDLPHPKQLKLGKNPVNGDDVTLNLPILDPREIKFVRPQIAGWGMGISPTVILKSLPPGAPGLTQAIKDMLVGGSRPDYNVGLGIGWVGFLTNENWLQLDGKAMPLYAGDNLADLNSNLPWKKPLEHINELNAAIFPGYSPVPKFDTRL